MKRYLLFISTIFLFSSCNLNQKKNTYLSFGGFTQGTTYSITYETEDSSNYKDEIELLLAEFDTSLSTYNPESVISKINRNESNRTDYYLNTVLKKSEEIYTLTNGSFDITVAPLVNAWGFGFENREEMTERKVDSLLQFIGFDKISYNDTILIKEDPRTMLDMNAIAQGYSVDIVAKFLDNKGITNYLVEIGGEVKTKGFNKTGKEWRIGIDKPFDNNNLPGENLQAIINLSNHSLATSGNYRKFYEKDGIKYAHTIDPKTGYSVTHSLLSATVIADECITADAYATAFMVIGLEKAYELAMKIPNLEAYFVFSDENGDYQVKITPDMKERIKEIK
ncbi:MAG: thiamine biosynthesis protein ApbE [Marinilabiliales bacterium]|nr:MAG: thiamine biosynthesis protein ApbE [Marinilabiliales bacterium]